MHSGNIDSLKIHCKHLKRADLGPTVLDEIIPILLYYFNVVEYLINKPT